MIEEKDLGCFSLGDTKDFRFSCEDSERMNESLMVYGVNQAIHQYGDPGTVADEAVDMAKSDPIDKRQAKHRPRQEP